MADRIRAGASAKVFLALAEARVNLLAFT